MATGLLPPTEVSYATAAEIADIANAESPGTSIAVARGDHVHKGKTFLLDSQPTVNDIVSTAALSTLYTFTVPANTVGVGDLLRLHLLTDYLNNNANGQTLLHKVTIGGVVFFQDTYTGIGQVAVRYPWSSQYEIAVLSATDTSMFGRWLRSSASAPTTGQGRFNGSEVGNSVFQGSGNVDWTASVVILVEVQHSSSSANQSLRRRGAALELSKAP